MIVSFRHKGLRKFFEHGQIGGINPTHINRLRILLIALNTAQSIEDTDVPGFQCHKLRGMSPTRFAISVNGNWRLTFVFTEGNVTLLDYEDYH